MQLKRSSDYAAKIVDGEIQKQAMWALLKKR